MPRTFTIRKQDGRWQNVKAWNEYLNSLPDGRYIAGELKLYKARSLPQNAFYWAVVVPMVYQGLRDAGFNLRHNDDAHEVLKTLFLKVQDEKAGIKIERIKSTTELTTTEFMEFLEAIAVWAYDYLNIVIPNPGEQTSIALAERDEEVNATIIQKG